MKGGVILIIGTVLLAALVLVVIYAVGIRNGRTEAWAEQRAKESHQDAVDRYHAIEAGDYEIKLQKETGAYWVRLVW